MIEQQQHSAYAPRQMYALEKHTYPSWIYLLGATVTLSFLYVLPQFLLHELPYQYELNREIAFAEQSFSDQHYKQVISTYAPIVKKHPQFKKGRMRIVQSCFELISLDESFYKYGLHYLAGNTYTDSEIAELYALLPAKYSQDFKAQFKRKR